MRHHLEIHLLHWEFSLLSDRPVWPYLDSTEPGSACDNEPCPYTDTNLRPPITGCWYFSSGWMYPPCRATLTQRRTQGLQRFLTDR